MLFDYECAHQPSFVFDGLPVLLRFCWPASRSAAVSVAHTKNKPQKLRRTANAARRLERVNGIEPSSPGWKPGVITIIRHPRDGEYKPKSDLGGMT